MHLISPDLALPDARPRLLVKLELVTPHRIHMHQVHRIDLLQRPAAALDQEEIHHGEGRQVAAREHVAVRVLDVARDERREEREHEVPEPVRRRRHGHRDRAVPVREHLADARPHERAPRGREADDEEAREHDHHGARRLRRGGALRGLFEDELPHRREDEETHALPERRDVQRFAPPEVARHVDAEERGADVDAAEDHGGHVRVGDADAGEDGGAVVEEVVRARELLQHLHGHGERHAVQHARAGDGFVPRVVALRGEAHLFDLGALGFDLVVVFGEAIEFGHRGACALAVAVVPFETGGLREEDDAYSEDEGPDEADCHWDSVGACVGTGFGSEVDGVGGEDPDGDEELVAATMALEEQISGG